MPDLLLQIHQTGLPAARRIRRDWCAIPLGVAGILDPVYVSSLGFLFGASILMSMVLGPCNTVTANVVPANRRAAAYATFIFLIHLFGDISSPILLGWISDLFGKPSVAGSSIGRLLRLDRCEARRRHQPDRRHARRSCRCWRWGAFSS